jgi:anionic cell wall polymer biosynthesis LytR-Cps2A-Psr (LCP) family protein
MKDPNVITNYSEIISQLTDVLEKNINSDDICTKVDTFYKGKQEIFRHYFKAIREVLNKKIY